MSEDLQVRYDVLLKETQRERENCALAEARAKAAEEALASYLSEGLTHRHVARGTDYRVLGVAMLQQATHDFPLTEDANMVVYRGADGSLWVRSQWEFNDGRFVELSKVKKEFEG